MNIAIVTGSSRGLGEALAAGLLARGWEVIGIARHDATSLAQEGYRFVRADLADAAGIDAALGAMFAQAAARRPKRAVLINNAASADVGVFGRMRSSDIAQQLCIDLAAPVALANLFCRTFADDACERRVINVSSGAAERTIAGLGVYSVSKAGLEMLTRTLAADHQTASLQAISLRPGVIDTDMQKFARSRSPEELPSVDLFVGFHEGGQLVAPATVARKVIDRLIEGRVESARTYSYSEL